MRNSYLFTSESVSEGHPDKVADQISDAIVDLFLSKDPEARVACETMTTTNRVVLAGEIRGRGIMDEDGNWAEGIREEIESTVRGVVKQIGYEQDGFHWDRLDFANHLHPQSAHIAQGVDAGENKDEGAGDQGIMFGFACDETPDLMPATLDYSHKILAEMVADQISDAIVDLFLSKDPEARVACETMTTTNRVVLAGEIRGRGIMDEDGNWAEGVREEIEATVRGVVRQIGYEQAGFHWDRLDFANHLHPQSAHIAQGVDAGENKDEGAGDQGIMFGFACDETPDLMPATLDYSHKILAEMAADRHAGRAPFLEPDAKSQVTLRFEDGKPSKATAIVVSTQHAPGYDKGEKQAELHAYVKGVVAKVLPPELLGNETVYHINPTGSFEIGGPDGDAGITGRKIIVDTYGGAAPHGGGAFSGKDPTKVDRSAAYAARYLAKNIVAAGFARRCTIQLAYAIGVSKPLSLYVDTHGTGTVDDAQLEQAIGKIEKLGGLTPRGIRTHLSLNKPIYQATAAYGHFGRKAEGDLFPWEKTDLVEDLKAAVA